MIDVSIRKATRARRAVVVAIAVSVLALGMVLIPMRVAGAAPPDPAGMAAADHGAAWIAAQVTQGGFIEGPGGTPAAGLTASAALTLATSGVEGDVFDRIVTWLESNFYDYVVDGDAKDRPGALAQLILIADAAGLDATNFGGHDLVARLVATLGEREPGLFGSQDPTYDGVYRQSLSLLALVASGATPSSAAIDWLAQQQCASPSEAMGGWQAYRADTSVPCDVPNPAYFTGPDTNSTSLAIEALVAIDGGPNGLTAIGEALDFLDGAQTPDGGFGYLPGAPADPNSTGLVLQALYASNENPVLGRWSEPDGNPVTSLLSWHIGCDALEADRGAFSSPYSSGAPDLFATLQAIWGASGQPFPVGKVEFDDPPVMCTALSEDDRDESPTEVVGQDDLVTTTTITNDTTAVPQSNLTTEATIAAAVMTQPALAG